MTREEMLKIKETRGYSYQYLAEKSGIEAATIHRILSGHTRRPRKATLDAIARALAPDAGFYDTSGGPWMLQEEVSAYQTAQDKQQGEFTVADLEATPEGTNVELIDGYLITSEFPTVKHQLIVQKIALRFSIFMESIGSECLLLSSPTAVQPDKDDDKNVYGPDMTVVCDPEKYRNVKRIQGAPDFVLEVLSPSTRKYDMTVKSAMYMRCGVRELWIIDQDKYLLIVYEGDKKVTPRFYDFDRTVPVALFDGALSIDLAAIRAECARRFPDELDA